MNRKEYLKQYYKRPEVKERKKEYRKLYRKRNKDKIAQVRKEYRIKNKEKASAYYKEYRKRNKDKINKRMKKYIKQRYNNDINIKISMLLRNRLWIAMKLYTSDGKIMSSKYMGIDWGLVMKKLIKEIPEDINEQAYDIDHIKPLCLFDLENPKEVKEAFAPENHQWLTPKENRKKGGRYLNSSGNTYYGN